jgi:AcrR family transcriptional regulator
MSANPDLEDDDAGPRRRTGGRSARVMAAVAQAVMDELAESGIENFSIPKVAARAGVSSSSIYRRWPTKTDLITFAAARQTERSMPIPDLGSLRTDLLRLLHEVTKFVTDPASGALIAMAFGNRSAESGAVQDALWRLRSEQHLPIFERAVARGEIAPGMDTGELIERAIGPIYVRVFISRRPVTADFLERLVDNVLSGCLAAPARGRRR